MENNANNSEITIEQPLVKPSKKSKSTFNSLYEVETLTIIESVDHCWRDFKLSDLLKFRNAIEVVLSSKAKNIFVIPKDEYNSNKYMNDIRLEWKRQNEINYSPIPQFIVGYDRRSNSNTIITVEQEIILNPSDEQFIIFLAFKLSLLDGKSIKGCIEYLSKKYFSRNVKQFLTNLDFMVADFASVFGERKEPLKQIIDIVKRENDAKTAALQKEVNPEMISTDVVIKNNDRPIEKNLEVDDSIILRQQVIILHYLFEACRDEKGEQPTMSDKARIVHAILGKKAPETIGGSNIYKYLDKILTANETTNVANLRFVRSVFEKLLLLKPIELIDKELKDSTA